MIHRQARDPHVNERLILDYLAKAGMLRPETDDAPEILVEDLSSLPDRDTEKKPNDVDKQPNGFRK
jgi:hypothetical protein